MTALLLAVIELYQLYNYGHVIKPYLYETSWIDALQATLYKQALSGIDDVAQWRHFLPECVWPKEDRY